MGPRDLVALAGKAERAGFEGRWISDHYDPWNDPNDVLPGELARVLPTPEHFEQASELVTEFEIYRDYVRPRVQ
jgi:alkanesulfonate monooxygenase SsuD/methylene tetrahydromethanopterin reductase-like flavin-dependent oxidoreductase (luciferase family)